MVACNNSASECVTITSSAYSLTSYALRTTAIRFFMLPLKSEIINEIHTISFWSQQLLSYIVLPTYAVG